MGGDDFASPRLTSIDDHEFSPEDIQALLGDVAPDSIIHDSNALAAAVAAAAVAAASSSSSTTAVGSSRRIMSARRTTMSPSVEDNDEEDNDDNITGGGGSGSAAAASAGGGGDDCQERALVMARTERKRKLEKQRRSDVNRQFAALQEMIRQIETADPEQVRGLPAYSPQNRVDLISRTVALLSNLHQSHKKMKCRVDDLEEQLQHAKKAGEEAAAKLKESMMSPQAMGNNKVMMMVPMMISSDGQGGMQPMMNPWMTAFQPQATNTSSSSADMTPPAASNPSVGLPMQMPWMMSSHPATTAAPTPWMMPIHAQLQPQQQQQLSMNDSSSSASSSGSKKPSSSSPSSLGGNLAHCA